MKVIEEINLQKALRNTPTYTMLFGVIIADSRGTIHIDFSTNAQTVQEAENQVRDFVKDNFLDVLDVRFKLKEVDRW